MIDETVSKGDRTRQAIIEAAYRLFADQGFHGTSMREIATGAGLALGGIYNHFDGKEAIFEAALLAKHPYREVLHILQSAPGETAADFVRNAARTVLSELGKRPDFLKLAFVELSEFKGKHAVVLYQTIFPEVLPVVMRLANLKGELRNDLPPQVILFSFLGLFFSFYMTTVVTAPDGVYHPDEAVLDQYVDMMLHGILKTEQA
jgi:AcrR family transcriptional regulator